MGLGRLLNICRSLEEESEVKRRSHEEKCLEITCCNLITNWLGTSRSTQRICRICQMDTFSSYASLETNVAAA